MVNYEARFWQRIEEDACHGRSQQAAILALLRDELARSATERASFLSLLASELAQAREERRELATRIQGWQPPAGGAGAPADPASESVPRANFASGLRDADFAQTLSRQGFIPAGDEANPDSWLHTATGESFDSAESAMYFAGLLAQGVPVAVALEMTGTVQEVAHAQGYEQERGPAAGGVRPQGP